MSQFNDPPADANPPRDPNEQEPTTQEVRHQQVAARVPESVSTGTYSTGVIVLAGGNEFVLDFLLRMARPHRIAARVILPPVVVPQVIAALRDNIRRYEERWGPIPPLPKPEIQRRPTIQEVYDELKIADGDLMGVYANMAVIGHTPAEFGVDFINNTFPRATVTARIFLAAPQVPRVVEALNNSWEQFIKRQAQRRQQPPPPSDDTPPPEGADSDNGPAPA